MKNYNDTIGNRTNDFPASGAVPPPNVDAQNYENITPA